MVNSYSHTSFTVSNIEKSIAFYVDQLGLTLTRRWERKGPEIQALTGVTDARLSMALVECGDFKLELIQYVDGAGEILNPVINNVGAAHIAFQVNDVDAFCKRLVENGMSREDSYRLVQKHAHTAWNQPQGDFKKNLEKNC